MDNKMARGRMSKHSFSLLDVTKNFIVKLKGLHTFNQSADKQLGFNKQLHRKKERKKFIKNMVIVTMSEDIPSEE